MSITLTTVILFAVFGVLLFLGVPISISIVVSSDIGRVDRQIRYRPCLTVVRKW